VKDLTSTVWIKSSRSGQQGNCVEIARNVAGIVAVRDSKDPGPALVVSPAAFRAFAASLKAQ
jgi:hypothetical protein